MKAHLLILGFVPAICLCQERIDRVYYETLLAQKEFTRVFLECDRHLKKSFGKTSHLTYYYLGKSLCGKGYSFQGKEWYKYIREKMPFDNDFRNELSKAEADCSTGSTTATPTIINVVINNYTPSTPGGIRGKSGFMLGCEKDVNENYENLKRNDSLDKRVFEQTEKKNAIARLRTFLSSKYNIDTSGRFIVVSLANLGYHHQNVLEVTAKLEFAYRFYLKKFNLNPTDKLFTVYLLPDKHSLRNAANDVHDIKISEANIGYSSLNDLSLLGIANPNSVGTLFHELFHLIIRSDIGDISPWLDEGTACLYSVYKISGDEIVGDYSTWRVTHFKLLMSFKSESKVTVPSLEQLINYNWEDYQGGPQTNLCIASVNYALSNLFVLYLQDKNLLSAVVDNIRNRRIFANDTLLPGPDDTKLIEMACKATIETISRNFYIWLKDRYNIDMPSLLAERQSFFLSDLPAKFQNLFNVADTLIAEIERTPNLIKRSTLKGLKNERQQLFYSIKSAHKNLIRTQSDMLTEFVDRNMGDNEFNNDEDEYYENNIREKEEDLYGYINKLKQIKSNSR